MNYYNAIVPDDLVEKLYKAGCPNIFRYDLDGKAHYSETTYADVFDGLIEKKLPPAIRVLRPGAVMGFIIHGDNTAGLCRLSWHEAANAIIEEAIKFLKENENEQESLC